MFINLTTRKQICIVLVHSKHIQQQLLTSCEKYIKIILPSYWNIGINTSRYGISANQSIKRRNIRTILLDEEQSDTDHDLVTAPTIYESISLRICIGYGFSLRQFRKLCTIVRCMAVIDSLSLSLSLSLPPSLSPSLIPSCSSHADPPHLDPVIILSLSFSTSLWKLWHQSKNVHGWRID